MAPRLAQLVTTVQTVEKQFEYAVADPGTPLEDVVALLQEYRRATDNVISLDFLHARSIDVETHLWAAHSRLNARLRKQLHKLRKERPSKPVETRKHIKTYLAFLKHSQRFYREHVQKLNASYGPFPELQHIARPVNGGTTASLQSVVTPEVRHHAILSCHQSLIYLGDLFRYRAAEQLDKAPDWGPAIGYYSVAVALRPCSGMAFHQQSVVAFEQGDHLRSTYYLYRAIVVEEPHPNAIANLEVQFRKVSAGWEKGDLIPKNAPNDKNASSKALIAWFVRFHSMCYKGQHFPQYTELEKEVLSRVRSELKRSTLDGILSKMTFINFAAQTTAGVQLQRNPDHNEYMQAYFFFLRFNVKSYTTILESFHEDLQAHWDKNTPEASSHKLSQRLPVTARHFLPCLRLYSSWLLANSCIVSADVGDDDLQRNIDDFWAMYSSTLSSLASKFPLPDLPEVEYQLEEEVDSFGFQPLESKKTQKLFAELKPKFSDANVQRRDVDTEMLVRVREMLSDAMLLVDDKNVPITFDGSNFLREDLSAANASNVAEEVPQPRQHEEPVAVEPHVISATPPRLEATPPKQAKTYNQEAQLSRMVDDLVGPEDDDDDDLPPTPPPQTVESARHFEAENGGFYTGNFRKGSLIQSMSPRGFPSVRTPELRSNAEVWLASNSPVSASSQRVHSVSSLWNDDIPQNSGPSTSNSGAQYQSRAAYNASAHLINGHTQAFPASSIRNSLPNQDGWSSFETTPQAIPAPVGRQERLSLQGLGAGGSYTGMHSPLLFGAGGGPWSTAPGKSLPNMTPPNGQGG